VKKINSRLEFLIEMNLRITNPELIAFCKTYQSFSIEDLALDYIRIISKLNTPVKPSDLLPCITNTIKQEFEKIHNSIHNTVKTVPNDTIISLIEKSTKDTKEFISHIPNNSTIQYLQDISTRLYRTATPDSLRNIPNDITLSQLTTILNNTSTSDQITRQILENLNEYISQFKTSSIKGRNTEVKTIMQLDQVFPKHDIQHVPSSKQKGKMDLILSLSNHPDISIDTKNYTKSVPKSEVLKFENDMTLGNTHGILLSISSKITSKPHFTIDIIQGNVAVYLSNTGNDTDCIKTAVDIIYNLSSIIHKTGSNTITDDTINKIKCVIQSDLVTINKIKTNLVSSIDLIKEMTFNKVSELLNV
jgi:hypothetical protein